MNRFGNDLVKLLGQIGERRSPLEAFRAFVKASACAVALQTREDEYLEEIRRWDRQSIEGFVEGFAMLVAAMDADPFHDQLGPVYMELGSQSSQKWSGEFYTPPDLCELIATMTMGDLEVSPDKPLEVLEPCCGAGAMILPMGKHLVDQGLSPLNMRATCVDVNALACDMCYVNLTLSMIPATVIHGNSLSLETWGGWRNMWWRSARGTQFSAIERTFLALMDMASAREQVPQLEAPTPIAVPEPERRRIVATVKHGSQFAFAFDEASEVAV